MNYLAAGGELGEQLVDLAAVVVEAGESRCGGWAEQGEVSEDFSGSARRLRRRGLRTGGGLHRVSLRRRGLRCRYPSRFG